MKTLYPQSDACFGFTGGGEVSPAEPSPRTATVLRHPTRSPAIQLSRTDAATTARVLPQAHMSPEIWGICATRST